MLLLADVAVGRCNCYDVLLLLVFFLEMLLL